MEHKRTETFIPVAHFNFLASGSGSSDGPVGPSGLFLPGGAARSTLRTGRCWMSSGMLHTESLVVALKKK